MINYLFSAFYSPNTSKSAYSGVEKRLKKVFFHSVDYKKANYYFIVLYKLKSLSIVLHAQDGGDRLHVLVVGHAGLAVSPVLEARLHDGDGLMGKKVAASGMLESE